MLMVQCMTQTGQYHLDNEMESQDIISVKQNERGEIAAVVCDGAGSSAYGGKAAETVCEILSLYLLNNFQKLLYQRADIIKQEVTKIIEQGLCEAAAEKEISSHLLSTTICAAVVDSRGRFVCLHLGDGSVLWERNEMNGMEYISSPENGILNSRTYLTMNCDMMKHLRVYKWERGDVNKIILMTDGISRDVYDKMKDSGQFMKAIYTQLNTKNIQDDGSCVVITLTNNEN